MPRYVLNKTRIPTKVATERAKKYRVRGYKNWIDPFPNVLGTKPEKIVYAALSYRGIPFWAQDEVRFSIPEIGFDKDYRPDFVLPTLRIIIEVQGAYFHSKPNVIDADAFKFAIYEQTGWRALAWWDFDILDNVNKLFQADPQLAAFPVIQNASSEQDNGRKVIRNDAKGIQTLNYKRGQRLRYRKKAVTVKSRKVLGYGNYATSTK